MAEFMLPSGRIIETHELTTGEFVHVVSSTHENMEALIYAKAALIFPGLTTEEIQAMPRADGMALLEEQSRIWDGRSEEEEVPLGDGGMLSFEASSLKMSLKPPPDMPSSDWLKWRDGWVGRWKNSGGQELKLDLSANGSTGAAVEVTAG